MLADAGKYLGSEASFYRVLKAEDLLTHREPSRPSTHHRPDELVATAPDQVWCWDITYLRTTVVGCFFYLYALEDLYSRKIVGWKIHEEENDEHSSALVRSTVTDQRRRDAQRAHLCLGAG